MTKSTPTKEKMASFWPEVRLPALVPTKEVRLLPFPLITNGFDKDSVVSNAEPVLPNT